MSKLRTITIDPQFLNISKKKSKSQKTNIPLTDIKINSSNIRELLLEKLKQHKKNKKTLKNPYIQLNTMDEQSKAFSGEIHNENSYDEIVNISQPNNNTPSTNNFISDTTTIIKSENNDNSELNKQINTLELEQSAFNTNIQPDKPYGVLKNGIKPTYKNWVTNDDTKINEPTNIAIPIQNVEPMIQEIEVNKVFQIGRNKKNKTVSVLLKNNNTRKKIENDKINFKKTNISTVKNFLKKQNLIKFGTTAPNNLLREIYESTKLCGEIINENNKAIIHNFKED
jgi:hypothetical protein